MMQCSILWKSLVSSIEGCNELSARYGNIVLNLPLKILCAQLVLKISLGSSILYIITNTRLDIWGVREEGGFSMQPPGSSIIYIIITICWGGGLVLLFYTL